MKHNILKIQNLENKIDAFIKEQKDVEHLKLMESYKDIKNDLLISKGNAGLQQANIAQTELQEEYKIMNQELEKEIMCMRWLKTIQIIMQCLRKILAILTNTIHILFQIKLKIDKIMVLNIEI